MFSEMEREENITLGVLYVKLQLLVLIPTFEIIWGAQTVEF